ncbi:HAD family phosphatase [Sphingomonas sp.]|uniref:HAD family hydrolase n=1 Tax=Sphingomonas sp. TaxID=28214 RepID=UPI00286BE86D|nr:HAD family phosphatase [Sphingomonas sp.]
MPALIIDFDGVLIESEYEGNRHLAELLTALGHPTTTDEALTHFTGLSGGDFIAAVEGTVGARLPAEFHARRAAEDERALRDGVPAVAGAIAFLRSLPPAWPKAVASSSTVHWVRTHLDNLGLADVFGDHIYSGREHVDRGKPAPDLYLYVAAQLGVVIAGCTIIEDSAVGATGALASGARVIGLVAGSHCLPGHEERLRSLGVRDIAHSFDDVSRLLNLG